MPKFIQRPRTVEAVQWTGYNVAEVTPLVASCTVRDDFSAFLVMRDGQQWTVPVGGWVVKHANDTEVQTDEFFRSQYVTLSEFGAALFEKDL